MSLPTTNTNLMLRLRNESDDQSWHQFVLAYQPALIRWLVQRGLQSSDAEDCVQQVLLAVMKSLPSFVDDGKPASFRRWLQTIARNELTNTLRIKARFPRSNRDSQVWLQLIDFTQDRGKLEESLEREYRRELFVHAAAVVRKSVHPSSWDAFWRTVVMGQTAPEAAKELGMNLGAIYMAKGRVLQKLKSIIDEMEAQS